MGFPCKLACRELCTTWCYPQGVSQHITGLQHHSVFLLPKKNLYEPFPANPAWAQALASHAMLCQTTLIFTLFLSSKLNAFPHCAASSCKCICKWFLQMPGCTKPKYYLYWKQGKRFFISVIFCHLFWAPQVFWAISSEWFLTTFPYNSFLGDLDIVFFSLYL